MMYMMKKKNWEYILRFVFIIRNIYLFFIPALGTEVNPQIPLIKPRAIKVLFVLFMLMR